MSDQVARSFNEETWQLNRGWKWLLLLGLALVVIGCVAIATPIWATAGVVMVLGIVLLAAGIGQIVSSFTSPKWSGMLLHIMLGILYAVTGFFVLENPVAGAAAMTLLLAAFFLISGMFRILFALRERFIGWGWTLFNGVVTLILGIIIWRQLPEASLWVIGLLVGIDLILAGWTWVMIACAVRSVPELSEPTP